MVSSDDVGIGRWHALAFRAALAVSCHAMLLGRRTRRTTSVLSAIVHAVIVVASTTMMRLGLRLGLLVLGVAVLMRAWRALDVDVGNAVTLTIMWQGFVLVGRLRIFGDDVPCVNEAGDVGETAEEDVDERIGAAETALYPDGQWGEENGEESEEEVGGTHCCVVESVLTLE